MKCELLYLISCWMITFNSSMILPIMPHILNIAAYHSATKTAALALPPVPTDMSSAFQLGILHNQLLISLSKELSTDSTVVREILDAAGKVCGRAITAKQLLDVLSEIQKVGEKTSLITRVVGFFSFVNIMWAFAILGICVSIGPALLVLLQPLRHLLLRVCRLVYEQILLPTAVRMHSWGVFEAMGYVTCVVGLAEGVRMGGDAGVFVALTAAVLSSLCGGYTNVLWGNRISQSLGTDNLVRSQLLWQFLCWIPLAVHFKSELFAYGAVIFLFIILGFSAHVGYLCLAFGFSDEASAMRVCVAAFTLTFGYIGLYIGKVDGELLQPFASPIVVFGCIMFFLSLLILGAEFRGSYSPRYFAINLATVFSLVVFQFVGQVLGVQSMANVSITFTVIWALQKYTEIHIGARWNMWLLVLILSLVIWRSSLYLHAHPEYVVGLFKMEIQAF